LQVATGSVTGVFSHLDEHRYLVATGWRDHASHEEYRRDRLPALAERAAPTDDLRRLSGYVVHVSEAWTVTAAAP
jgi:heme-degrading monooxygenase HmoA